MLRRVEPQFQLLCVLQMKAETIIVTVGIAVAATLIANEIWGVWGKNFALPTCQAGKAHPTRGTALTRGYACASAFGSKAAVELEMAACPLGPTCNIGGVCACTLCGPLPNGVQPKQVEQSGALQTWGARPFNCGRTSCYAAVIKRGQTCSSQVVATQGAAGTCGWGKCADFNSCC